MIFAILGVLPVVLLVADRWIGLSWVVMAAACLLCIVEGHDPTPLLARVDAALLLFFSGLFVVVAGLNATGVPSDAWDAMSSAASSLRTGSGVALFVAIVAVGSNTVSNVPLVLLLAPKVEEQPTPADALLAWALLSWASTVAGNLTLLGSVANLIVAERAKAAYTLSFTEYLKVGLPSTILLLAGATPIVYGCTTAIVASTG
jgi:Na+/H+ antiporter NhaD/arsenite permease-like protein